MDRVGTTEPTSRGRVLVVASVPYMFERFLLPHVSALKTAGYHVEIAFDFQGTSTGVDLRGEVCHHLPFGRNAGAVWRYIQAIRPLQSLVRRGRFEVVWVHAPISGAITRFALRRLRHKLGVKVLYTVHGFHFAPGLSPVRNWVFEGIERLAARWSDAIIVMNRYDEEAILKWGAMPPGSVLLSPGVGIDLSAYAGDRERRQSEVIRVRRELVGNTAGPVLVIVGGLSSGKRTSDALRLCALEQFSACELMIVGTGPMRDQLEALARELGIGSRVHFLGFREDVPRILGVADALLMPSEREGLPRAVMEAMAAGVPVVGAVARGTVDLLDEGRGYLHPVGDIGAMATALSQALTDGKDSAVTQRAANYVSKLSLAHATEFSLRVIEALNERGKLIESTR